MSTRAYVIVTDHSAYGRWRADGAEPEVAPEPPVTLRAALPAGPAVARLVARAMLVAALLAGVWIAAVTGWELTRALRP